MHAPVAQRIERFRPKEIVAGSNPARGTNDGAMTFRLSGRRFYSQTGFEPIGENSQWLFEFSLLGRHAQLRSNFVAGAE